MAKDLHHILGNLFFDQFSHFYFCEKSSKNKVFRFERQSIGNLITSSARYGTPYSDPISQNDRQNTKFFLAKNGDSIFFNKNSLFFSGFSVVTWSNQRAQLKA